MSAYDEIMDTIRYTSQGTNHPPLEIGKVISEEPLEIQKGSLILKNKHLLVADYLTKKYEREAEYTWQDKDGAEGTMVRKIKYEDQLKVDDDVVLMAVKDRQTYIVLARVVKYE